MSKTEQTEAILGWRLWKIRDGVTTPRLHSLITSTEWIPQQALRAKPCTQYVIADFDYSDHSFIRSWRHKRRYPRKRSCECGIYAKRDFPSMKRFAERCNLWERRDVAFGRVSLWGNIVEHEDGYRAEFAYPLDLYIYSGLLVTQYDQGLTRGLRDAYAVEVSFGLPKVAIA